MGMDSQSVSCRGMGRRGRGGGAEFSAVLGAKCRAESKGAGVKQFGRDQGFLYLWQMGRGANESEPSPLSDGAPLLMGEVQARLLGGGVRPLSSLLTPGGHARP